MTGSSLAVLFAIWMTIPVVPVRLTNHLTSCGYFLPCAGLNFIQVLQNVRSHVKVLLRAMWWSFISIPVCGLLRLRCREALVRMLSVVTDMGWGTAFYSLAGKVYLSLKTLGGRDNYTKRLLHH